MADLILLFVPFFALVLLGWGATRGHVLPVEGIGALNAFVLYFGLTAMVFRLSAGGALQHGAWLPLVAAYALGGAVVLVIALAWAWCVGVDRRTGGLAALVAVFPNTGFLGLPLLTGLLGPQAAGPVVATLLVDVLLFSSVCLAFAHAGGQGGSMWAAVLQSLKGAARNPLLWAMVAGLAVSWTGGRLAGPLDDTLRLLSLSATPTALFTLGAILAQAQMAQGVAGTGFTASPRLPIMLKLLLHPALVWGAGQALGLGRTPQEAQGLLTLTLAAALPSASNVLMLARREGADAVFIARIILWTTAVSLLTLTVLARALGVDAVPGAAPG